ncbi:MAG TPA: PEPxxWA-CTERM sorting domain-containing protein [Caulobacteraceae bacterium]|jgi:hypothetical protein
MIKTTTLIAAAALALSAGMAHASTQVLFDDFNGDTPGTPAAGDALLTSTSPPGSIDIIGSGLLGTSFDFLPGNGYYVDMDGSTGSGNNPAGELTSTHSFGPGSYTLTFDLDGNERNATPQTLDVLFGTTVIGQFLNVPSTNSFTLQTLNFTSPTAGNLIFRELGPSDQQGNLLDNVSLVSVPEPASWTMMLLGLGAIGGGLRMTRRKEALSVA